MRPFFLALSLSLFLISSCQRTSPRRGREKGIIEKRKEEGGKKRGTFFVALSQLLATWKWKRNVRTLSLSPVFFPFPFFKQSKQHPQSFQSHPYSGQTSSRSRWSLIMRRPRRHSSARRQDVPFHSMCVSHKTRVRILSSTVPRYAPRDDDHLNSWLGILTTFITWL